LYSAHVAGVGAVRSFSQQRLHILNQLRGFLLLPTAKVRAYSHLLGETGTSFVAMPVVAGRCKGRFPRSLDGIPLLLPADNTAIRRDLDDWLRAQNVRPERVGAFEDSPCSATLERLVRAYFRRRGKSGSDLAFGGNIVIAALAGYHLTHSAWRHYLHMPADGALPL
jgi:hypothetical protein